MVPHLSHWLRVALATFLSCIAVYEIFTDGLGETSTWLWVADAALMISAAVIEGVRIWRGEPTHERRPR